MEDARILSIWDEKTAVQSLFFFLPRKSSNNTRLSQGMSLFCSLKSLDAQSTRDDAQDLLEPEYSESNMLDDSDLWPVDMGVNFCLVDEQ